MEAGKSNGVTGVQAMAMLWGAFCGWRVPAADPSNYNSEGKYVGDMKIMI
jgi:hypothetical protein